MMDGKRYPELTKALKRIAAPIHVDERISDYIARAAVRCGLTYWRTFDVYYGKARKVHLFEAIRIRDALIRATR